MKTFLFLLMFLFLLPMASADYFFDTAQCACDNGIELVDSSRQGNLLSCIYRMEGSKSYIRPKLTVQVRTYISERFLREGKERYQKDYDRLSTSDRSSFYFDDFYIGDNNARIIYYESSIPGKGTRIGNSVTEYKDTNILIYATDLEINIKEPMIKTEECMKKAVDDSIKKRDEAESNRIKLNLSVKDRPLENMVVIQNRVLGTTNEDGIVTLEDNLEELEIEFKYKSDNKDIFSISVEEDKTFAIKMEIEDGKIKEMIADAGYEEKKLKIINTDLSKFNLEDYDEQIGFYTHNYLYFQDATQFYESLGVDFKKPVNIILSANYAKKAAYNDYKIIMDRELSNPGDVFSPYTQYHEFSHFVMHTMYGSVFEEIIKEKNHGGFANPTTMDSWAEGFAAFMAVVIANDVDHYWADTPSGKNPALYPPVASIDINYKAWEKEGKAEEIAIAGVLWDILDDKAMNERKLLGMDMALSFYVKSADENDDGIVTKEEYALDRLRAAGASAEYDYVNWLGMIDYGYELASVYDIEVDMTIFDKYRGDNNELDTQELETMAEIMKYEYKDEIVEKWLEVYDEDKDGYISEEEADNLLMGYEVIKAVSEDEEEINWYRLGQLSRDPKIQDAYWPLEGKKEATIDEFINILKKEAIIDDDDEINIEFEALWEVMKNNHKDFTSFLDEFTENLYEDEVIPFSEILLAHGIYADRTEGNKVYDKGIEAFIDTNDDGIRQENEKFIDYPNVWVLDEEDNFAAPSNYERPERHSIFEFPGHYIEGATSASYIIWKKGKIVDAITIKTDGYVPVPPKTKIYVEKDDEVIKFTSISFEEDYPEIKERGSIVSSNTSSGSSSGGGGNGIWFFLGFVGLIIFLISRKKKKTK